MQLMSITTNIVSSKPFRRGVLDTTLIHVIKFAASRWFSPGTPVSSTNKTDHHDITDILLKVALKHYKPILHGFVHHCYILYITEMPLGFMPLLEVDGRQLSQSMAVTRFIAKRCGELYIQCRMTRHTMQGYFFQSMSNKKPPVEEGQTMQWSQETRGQTMIYKVLRRKQKIEQHEPH